ncbi:MAG: glutamate 5-kinase [Lentisphaeraceae bacterium]|nr:glutamate 5-kinase [Lentisphaeraceae bacterium]
MDNLRKKIISGTTRIVLKVGSRLLVDENRHPSIERINSLVAQIAKLRESGLEVVLVSSGAISAGMSVLGLDKRPKVVPDLQAAAAIGQSRLLSIYEDACRKHGFHCGQILLTAGDVQDRKRHLNLSNCLNALLAQGSLPIINENDSISIEEICFGENDHLAALVGTICRAELTVLLTSVDGMYEKLADGKFGERISVVEELTPELKAMATGTDGNQLSTGGMETKLKAAETLTSVGESLWIVDGTNFDVISDVHAGRDIGTLFPGSEDKMRSHKRWMAFFPEVSGEIIIDDGAQNALINKGSSLLPGGIRFISGAFMKGDVVEIKNVAGEVLAKGVVNYSASELELIKGEKTTEIFELLGYHIHDEAIHRDNLVVLTNEDN